MKILFINNFYYLRGGSERVFFGEMELMQRHGHQVIAFARSHEKDFPSDYADYFAGPMNTDDVHLSLKDLRTGIGIIHSRSARRNIDMLASVEQPDVAHAHNIYSRLSTSVLEALSDRNIPIAMTLHDYKLACPIYNFTYDHQICEDCKPHRYYRAVLKRCHRNSYITSLVYTIESYYNLLLKRYVNNVSVFIAPSRFLVAKLTEYGLPKDKFAYVPNAIDVDSYPENASPGKYLLYLGRLSEEKGVSVLVDAFKAGRMQNTELVITGEGPLKEQLIQSAKSDRRILFTGYLSGKELQQTIQGARAIILPSICYENAPISILEAMASGKPVIGADIGGIPEMVRDGLTGYLFKPNDRQDLGNKIDQILSLSSGALVEMGKVARHIAKTEYNQDVHYQNLMNIYRNIIRRES